MQYVTDFHDVSSRFWHLAEELSADCDSDFDVQREDLEREFAELRLQLANQE